MPSAKPKCWLCGCPEVYPLSGSRLKCLNIKCGHIWPVATSQWLDVKYADLHRERPNRPTTVSQDQFKERAENNPVTKVAGKSWECDPEAVVVRIWNKIFRRG